MAAKKKIAQPMLKWKPAPEGLVRVFQEAIEAIPDAQPRKMFGYPAAFIDGHLFAGLHQETMILRLSTEDQAILLKQKGARIFEPMPGRPMRGYVVVPPAVIKAPEQLSHWLARALAHTKSLPPKPAQPAPKKKKTL
jgi:TfoX/Sxy family transcriptional regulator of competence genes